MSFLKLVSKYFINKRLFLKLDKNLLCFNITIYIVIEINNMIPGLTKDMLQN